MPIRITGMYSGLDTEAIIAELASAQSMKKNSLVKKQISLSWKMDAWKALNTKIYSFYSKTLDNMRFQSSYALKTTKVSGSSVSVTTKNNAVNGVQDLKIEKMAKMGYLTGGKIATTEGGKVSASTKLSDLGIGEDGSFSVEVGGKSVKIDVTEGMKVSDVVAKLQSAGLNASFDEKNQRFFVSSQKTGEEYNFHLVGDNENGMKALGALGLLTETDLKSGAYKTWADYKDSAGNYTDAYNKALQKEVAARAASYKKANDNLKETNKKLETEIETLKNDPGYNKEKNADALYEDLYGKVEEGSETGERTGGLYDELDKLQDSLKEQQELYDKRAAEGADESELKALQDNIDGTKGLLADKQAELKKTEGQYSIAKAIKDKQDSIAKNEAQMNKNQTYFVVDEETEKTTGTTDLEAMVKAEFDAKIENAQDTLNKLDTLDKLKDIYEKGGSLEDLSQDETLKDLMSPGKTLEELISQTAEGLISQGATKIEGQDATIYLNGAEFTSESNTFDINGLEITVLEENTEDTITLSTGEDIDGIYNMVKNFLTEYNKLINEMDALYNADSSKGYDPLLTEEKNGLSDSEIEEWEKKIKDSILRRDQRLGDVTGALSNTMLAGAEVNGVQMFLSQFGINTLGYFNAADNEKRAYHIDGDPDDANTMSKDDVLRSMIASDPETVMKFFSQLSKNVYDELGRQMAGTTASSAFTVYNDKTMKDEYDAYTEKIAKQESKLNSLMEKWYSKFSKMETAMSKLESKNSALASMLGG